MIGYIEANIGIINPIARAYIIEVVDGTGSLGTPRSFVRSLSYINPRVGKLNTKPVIIAGNTNINPCKRIIIIMPYLLSPTILITPISKVLVSTLIINSEYIKSTDITTNSRIMMSKMSPINSTA